MSKRKGELNESESKRRRRNEPLENPKNENGLSQCFRKVKVLMNVYTAPAFANNPIEGIQKEHLDPMILQFDNNSKGIVVAYNNVKLLKRKGTPKPLGEIISESPFSFYWISVELVVWYPQQGDVLEAWISVQSPGHLALLIHETFNATIKRGDIPQDWTFVPQEDDEADKNNKSLGYWQDANGTRIEGKLQFTVKRFLHGGRTPLVLGTLLTEGEVLEEAEPQEEEQQQEQQDAVEKEEIKPKKIKFD